MINFLLSIVTLGFYALGWFYRVLKDSSRISDDDRNVVNVFWAMLACYLLAVSSLIAIIVLMAVYSNGALLTGQMTLVVFFTMTAENFRALFIAITALLICDSIFIIAECVLQIILVYRLAKNIDGDAAYYIVFDLFLGITVAAIFAQDVINRYSGTYKSGERPLYYGVKARTSAI